MPISWLTALKVIPWGDVIEHAPKVLKTARDLLNQQRQRRSEQVDPGPDLVADGVDEAGPAAPDWRALEGALLDVREEISRLQQTQEQMAQTLADLAEQNTRLVAAVEVLRKRTRLLVVGVLVLLLLLGAVWAQ